MPHNTRMTEINIVLKISIDVQEMSQSQKKTYPSRKHAYIILIPLNPTLI